MPHAALPEWMDRPWTQAWLSFNLVPARWTHPEQRAHLLPGPVLGVLAEVPGREMDRDLERHWSGAMLREPQMSPVDRLDDPVLPLALLNDKTLERVALWCGLVVIGGPIRKVIARDEVARLTADIGEDGLQFVRSRASAMRSDSPALAYDTVTGASPAAIRLGTAILACAFGLGTPPVKARASLRLAPDAFQAVANLPADLLAGGPALELARQVLQEIDPQWLSSFPTPH